MFQFVKDMLDVLSVLDHWRMLWRGLCGAALRSAQTGVTPETIIMWQCRQFTKLWHSFWLQCLVTKLVFWSRYAITHLWFSLKFNWRFIKLP